MGADGRMRNEESKNKAREVEMIDQCFFVVAYMVTDKKFNMLAKTVFTRREDQGEE